MNGFENSLQLFLTGFTARDIAAPLVSFDEQTPQAAIRTALAERKFEVAGVRRSGSVVGWLAMEDLIESQQPAPCRSFDAIAVIDDTAPLHEVVAGLNRGPVLFVRSFGEVGGLIRRSDLEKPAVRMWLFGLVTVMELRVTGLIDEHHPADSWRRFLSEGRQQMAVALQAERSRRGQDRSLLDCLQFADKGRIMASDEQLRGHTRFTSKRGMESFVQGLQDLRNNLAHAQDLTGDWEVIVELAMNLHHIIVGKQTTAELAAPNET